MKFEDINSDGYIDIVLVDCIEDKHSPVILINNS